MRDRGNDPATASYAAGLAPATQYPPGWLRWRRHARDGARQHFLQWLVGLGRCRAE
jgi:hypothetical protein